MKYYFRSNNAELGAVTAGDTTSASIAITGSLKWYKDGAWGYAYKKHSATTWTYVPTDSQDIEATISGLSANTKYDICLYVYAFGEYQRGPVAEKTTSAS